MIRTSSSKQLTIAKFDWPFETTLDKNNRWVKLSQRIPWDEQAESGRPMKDTRLVIGAVITNMSFACLMLRPFNKSRKPRICNTFGLSGHHE